MYTTTDSRALEARAFENNMKLLKPYYLKEFFPCEWFSHGAEVRNLLEHAKQAWL